MMNIYARTFMIATLADQTEPAERTVRHRGTGWIARARRWAAAHGEGRHGS